MNSQKNTTGLHPHGWNMEYPLWVFWRIKLVPWRGSTVLMVSSWHGHTFRFASDMWGESIGHWFEIGLRSYDVTTMESLYEYFVEEWAWNKRVRLRMSVSHSSSYHVAPTETTNKTALQLYWRITVCACVCPYLYCPWRSVFKFFIRMNCPHVYNYILSKTFNRLQANCFTFASHIGVYTFA